MGLARYRDSPHNFSATRRIRCYMLSRGNTAWSHELVSMPLLFVFHYLPLIPVKYRSYMVYKSEAGKACGEVYSL